MLSWANSLAERVFVAFFLYLAATCPATSGPVDIVLDPSPQETGSDCQSYSLALALSLNPNSPIKADTPKALRNLEESIRAEIVDRAAGHEPGRADWAFAVDTVTHGKLKLVSKSFAHLDDLMRFVGNLTQITAPSTLGLNLSAILVHTPVLLSFTRIGNSIYPGGHIVTALGVDLPPASMGDNAHPGLLMVNSAVKYKDNIKRICAKSDLSDTDRYSATSTIVTNYDLKKFDPKPYLVDYLASP
jgi:hypothetical protein